MNADPKDLPTAMRVAPSPTGEPHVGTAYVALFNVLSLQPGGRFICRIEDTDSARLVEGAERNILESLEWLGLTPDESPLKGGPVGPYRQSERLELYRQAAWELVEAGEAYPAFETEDELTALRESTDGKVMQLPSRDLSPAEARARAEAGEKHVIRLKAPREGQVRFEDSLRGELSFDAAEIDDKVLLKSDGGATYHLASVVDDRAMGVKRVMRAEEWITSTPVHVLLHRALDRARGEDKSVAYSHLSLLRNPGGSKISKRKNPVSLTWYRAQGILPEALLSFLSTMGWAGRPEGFLTLAQMREAFSLDQLKAGAPVFDLERLLHHSGERLRSLAGSELITRVEEHARHHGLEWSPAAAACLERAPGVLAKRARTLEELRTLCLRLAAPPRSALEGELQSALGRIAQAMQGGQGLLEATRGEAERGELKMKELGRAVRTRLTGSEDAPSMDELELIIGQQQVTQRLSA